MTLNNSSLVATVGVLAVFGCALSFGQEIQRLEQRPAGVKPVTQPIASYESKEEAPEPYALSREQTLILRQLSPAQKRQVTDIARRLSTNSSFSAVRPSWGNLVTEVSRQNPVVDVGGLSHQVLNDSARIANSNVNSLAEKVRGLQEARQEAQKESQFLHRELAQLMNYTDGSLFDKQRADVEAQVEQTQARISIVENRIKKIEHDLQAAMLQLQNAMNAQAQLMQMMSNIQKLMNDTAMAIIRNMK
jgi:hypothetical protein